MFLPSLYFPVAALVVVLLVETWLKRDQSWALPAAVVYLTIGAWYFADLFISPENYNELSEELLNLSHLQIAAFLLSFRLFLPPVTAKLTTNATRPLVFSKLPTPGTLFAGALVLWLALLGYGVFRMNGDLIASLFPLDARAGMSMWLRSAGADAGPAGFLISAASYLD